MCVSNEIHFLYSRDVTMLYVQLRSCRGTDHQLLFPNKSNFIADGPKNIAVTPEHKAYKPGTTIQVTADSVPPLGSYKWVDTTKNTSVGTGNSFIITSNMVGRASLKVVLCNTMPIPPVYDVCCEVTLSFEVGCTCTVIVLMF